MKTQLGEWTRHALNIPELAAYEVKHYRLDVDDGYLEVFVGREPIGWMAFWLRAAFKVPRLALTLLS